MCVPDVGYSYHIFYSGHEGLAPGRRCACSSLTLLSMPTTPLTSLHTLAVVALAAALAALTWYATLTPFWVTQSGRRAGGGASYAQGIGLWLNYTEHVGDAAYDPSNSLWIPAQQSAAHSFADQWCVP